MVQRRQDKSARPGQLELRQVSSSRGDQAFADTESLAKVLAYQVAPGKIAASGMPASASNAAI